MFEGAELVRRSESSAETKVLMKRIGNIYKEVISIDNCKAAIINASKNKKRRKSVQKILDNLDYYANELMIRLEELSFCTGYTHRKITDKPSGKERDLYIPAFFPDQCAHHAIIQVLKPYIIKSSYEWSCACIPGRGIKKACIGVEKATMRDKRHAKYCVKMDIEKFYSTVDHETLKQVVRHKIKDKEFINMLDIVIDSHNSGLPIGNYTSPWLAEMLLQPFDMYVKHELGVDHFVRYADDIVFIGNNKKKLRYAMNKSIEFLSKYNLKVKSNYQLFRIKGQNCNGRAIDFVGKCFAKGSTRVRKRRALAFMRQSREIVKLQRNSGDIPFKTASGFISRSSCLNHADTCGLKAKYYDCIDISSLKEVIRNESKQWC